MLETVAYGVPAFFAGICGLGAMYLYVRALGTWDLQDPNPKFDLLNPLFALLGPRLSGRWRKPHRLFVTSLLVAEIGGVLTCATLCVSHALLALCAYTGAFCAIAAIGVVLIEALLRAHLASAPRK